MKLNWQSIEQSAFDHLPSCLTHIRQAALPSKSIPMFHAFYGNSKNIYFPAVFSEHGRAAGTGCTEIPCQPIFADESSRNLKQSLCRAGADLAEYLFEGGTVYHKLAETVSRFAAEKSGYTFDDGGTETHISPHGIKFTKIPGWLARSVSAGNGISANRRHDGAGLHCLG